MIFIFYKSASVKILQNRQNRFLATLTRFIAKIHVIFVFNIVPIKNSGNIKTDFFHKPILTNASFETSFLQNK